MSIYSEPVPLSSILPINVGLNSAKEETMISVLGPPHMPLTHEDSPDRASDVVKKLRVTDKVAGFRVTGIKPAVESLKAIFQLVAQREPDLAKAVGSDGMLVVRLRRPTRAKRPSTQISNHSWGTAVDFHIDQGAPLGDTGQTVPRGIAMLVPFFNQAGWYSGITFHDDMHFEVAEETIKRWSSEGKFKVPGVNA